MNVLLNGQALVSPCRTIAELVETHHLADQRIAVERNGQIVPKGLHASTLIQDGDHIEIVVAVGGG